MQTSFYMAKNKVILDSNIYIAYYLEEDTLHEEALLLVKEFSNCKILISHGVIQEVATVLTYKKGKKIADIFLKDILKANNIEFISNDIEEAIQFFTQVHKKLSFIDLSLVQLAIKYGAQLFTFDKQLLSFYKNTPTA